MTRIVAAVIAILGWVSLALQFVLHMNSPLAQDASFAERLTRFFSYFTVSTNIIVAVTLTAVAFFPEAKFGLFFSKPSTQAAVASYISIVGLIYSLFLRSVWAPEGWNAVADHALHDAMPLLYLVYWLFLVEKKGISWISPLWWLIYPIIYVGYSLIRGAYVNWYPYWFADAGQLGYPVALRNTFFVLVAFFVVGMIFVAIGKLLGGRSNAAVS